MKNKELFKIIEDIKRLVNNPKQAVHKKEQKEIEIEEDKKEEIKTIPKKKEEQKQEDYSERSCGYIYTGDCLDDSNIQAFKINGKVVYAKKTKLNMGG